MTTMRNIWAIFRRETGSYFLSPMAYVVLVLFLFTCGYMFSTYCFLFAGRPDQITLVVESLFDFGLLWVIPLSPLITMRVFAEEKRTGSLELLMTAPVRDVEVVLGKFLSAQCFYSFVWLSLAPLFGVLAVLGEPDWGPVISTGVGLFCLGILTNALGVLASAGTRNQLVSAIIALSGNLFLMLVVLLGRLFPNDPESARLVRYMSFTDHFGSDYLRGVVDLRHLFFYVSFAVLLLFFAVRMVEARKWR